MWRRPWAALVAPNGGGDAHGVRVGRGRRVRGHGAPLVCDVGHRGVIDRSVLLIMRDAGCATRVMPGNGGRWCSRGPGGAVGMSVGGQDRWRSHPGLPTYQTSVLSPYSTTRLYVCHGHVQRAACTATAAGGAPAGRVVPWGCPWVGKTVVVPYGPAYVPNKRPVSVLSPV